MIEASPDDEGKTAEVIVDVEREREGYEDMTGMATSPLSLEGMKILC